MANNRGISIVGIVVVIVVIVIGIISIARAGTLVPGTLVPVPAVSRVGVLDQLTVPVMVSVDEAAVAVNVYQVVAKSVDVPADLTADVYVNPVRGNVVDTVGATSYVS